MKSQSETRAQRFLVEASNCLMQGSMYAKKDTGLGGDNDWKTDGSIPSLCSHSIMSLSVSSP